MERDEILKAAYGSSRVGDILPELVKDGSKVRTLSQLSSFAQKYSLFVYADTKVNTLKSRVTDVRNELKKAGARVEVIELFTLPTSIYGELIIKSNAKIKDKLSSSSDLKMDFAKFTEATILKLIDEIKSGDVEALSNNSKVSRELAYKKLIVVALATGRRQIEILKTLSLRKKRDEAIYSGLVKKGSEGFELIAPILADINIIKKYLNDIRAEFQTEEMANKAINSKYNASVSKSLFRYLPSNVASEGFHFLRTCYAQTCFSKFANGADKNIYFSQILGHEESVNAAHHYQAKGVK